MGYNLGAKRRSPCVCVPARAAGELDFLLCAFYTVAKLYGETFKEL